MVARPYDSSLTRVVPVFTALQNRLDTWLRDLLLLAEDGARPSGLDHLDLSFLRGFWGTEERGLQPPVALLSWLIRNLQNPQASTTIDENRRALLRRDPQTVELALRLLRTEGVSSAWHVFEGPTYPDAFIETPDALIVIEGKRTEAGPTTSTTWLAGRHQIWQHIDAAWEIRGRRAVYGLFLVEGQPASEGADVIPDVWRATVRDALSQQVLDSSFPHRSVSERIAIAKCLLGVATWQRVCKRCGIDYASLPDTIPVTQRYCQSDSTA